jgi:hypothetical protein
MANIRTCPTWPGQWGYPSAKYTASVWVNAALMRNLSSVQKGLSQTTGSMNSSTSTPNSLQAIWWRHPLPATSPHNPALHYGVFLELKNDLTLNLKILRLDFTQRIGTLKMVDIERPVEMVNFMFQCLGQQTFRFYPDFFPLDIETLGRYRFRPV